MVDGASRKGTHLQHGQLSKGSGRLQLRPLVPSDMAVLERDASIVEQDAGQLGAAWQIKIDKSDLGWLGHGAAAGPVALSSLSLEAGPRCVNKLS